MHDGHTGLCVTTTWHYHIATPSTTAASAPLGARPNRADLTGAATSSDGTLQMQVRAERAETTP